MKKIVVFGGAGFLGSHMVDYLNCKYKNRVFSFDLKPHSSLPAEKNIIGDISDKELVKSALKGTHTVFNYIAVSDIEECIRDPLKAAQINICGNAVLMEACIEEKVHRFVFASSVYAESSLGGVYRTTKMASESLIKDTNNFCIPPTWVVPIFKLSPKEIIFLVVVSALSNQKDIDTSPEDPVKFAALECCI